jgi:hypothetical protein
MKILCAGDVGVKGRDTKIERRSFIKSMAVGAGAISVTAPTPVIVTGAPGEELEARQSRESASGLGYQSWPLGALALRLADDLVSYTERPRRL